MLTAAGVVSPVQCINPNPANQQLNRISIKSSSSQPTNQQLATLSDSCVELPGSPIIFSNNNATHGYQPSTPGYQLNIPGYQPPTPGYQPHTPGYQHSTPGYQPPTPGYQPPTPGYQPMIAQHGAFVFDPNCIPTEDLEKNSVPSTPEPQKSPTTPPSRRLSFTSSRPPGSGSFKKGLERGVRKDACRGGCFVCPTDPSPPTLPSNDGDNGRLEPATLLAPPTRTEEATAAPSITGQCVEAGMEGSMTGAPSQIEGWRESVVPAVPVELPRQFVYPGHGYYNYPGPGYYNNVPLAPLTPITPSVDPAAGFKTGYIEPQTPNPMTPNQFYYYFQASPFPYSPMDGAPQVSYQPIQGLQVQPFQGQPIQGIQGVPTGTTSLSQAIPIPADPVQLSQPPPGKSANENFQSDKTSQGSAFTFLKPAAKKSRSYMENNNGPYNGNNRNNGPYNNNTSYFTSPFKTFTSFKGTPSPTRYPLRSPNYRPARMNLNRRSKNRNLSWTNPQDKDKAGVEAGSDTKANWYKAGERFGVSSTFQKRNKSVNDVVPASSDLATSTSATPLVGLTPPLTPLSSVEPDLIAGQMQKISLK